MHIAIGIPTYYRQDGKTAEYLTKALLSIKNQTYQKYKIFLIGDKYENETELFKLAQIIPKEKIFVTNLNIAAERDIYPIGSRHLWCSGGVNAYNTAIDACLEQGFEYMCHLDHDDFWEKDHLQTINKVIQLKKNSGCIYTCSNFKNSGYLPRIQKLDQKIQEAFPIPCNVVHSSVCINHNIIPLKYRDVYKQTGQLIEADIDMWQRLTEYCLNNNIKSYLVNKITCNHMLEQH